jgi:LuxR family maltose regulon positive regulatory protein
LEQLLTTKLNIPPIRLKLVNRPRLTTVLNRGLDQKLILVSTPAGFGKTTLVSGWVEALQSKPPSGDQPKNIIAWLSVDDNDNDPNRFLTYFTAALRHAEGIEPNFGKGTFDMLKSPHPHSAESILISLINEIADYPATFIFVLDDYHHIESQEVNHGISFLLEHQPPNFHLVIATREDPQLPLARLRARGQLSELRATSLRFTSSEAADFLNAVMELELSEEDIVSLESRTEGWIAGLQLAAVSMQGREDPSNMIKAFTGSHRLVLDYLIEEVLGQQPEHLQTFLLRTAILDRMNGSLCNAVTGQSEGEATLIDLEHANLFIIPLDEERRWYRYHHLFSDLLRSRLQKSPSEDEADLHDRASSWFVEHGFIDDAIEHAHRARNYQRVVELVDENSESIWRSGGHTKLHRWLSDAPEELVLSKPNICILNAWNLFIRGQREEAEKMLDCLPAGRAGAAQKKGSQKSTSDNKSLQGRAAAIRAFLASHRGDIPEIVEQSRKALEFLPEQDRSWRSAAAIALGDAYNFNREIENSVQMRLEAYELSKAANNIYLNLIASMKLAVSMRNQGKLHKVIELCDKQMQFAKENGVSKTDTVGWLLAVWGEALAETNDLDGALDLVIRGVELTERGADVASRGWAYLCLLRILYSRREWEGFETLLNKIDHFSREHRVPPWVGNIMEALKARALLAQDKIDSASNWVVDYGLDPDHAPQPIEEHMYLAFARVLSAQGQADEAIRLLERMLELAEEYKNTSRLVEILIIKALAHQKSGQTDQAKAELKRALTIAEPGGFIRIFLDEGPQLARLLSEVIEDGYASEYASQLLSAFQIPSLLITPKTKMQVIEDEFIEPLSEREIDVLRLIAQGLTNKEIAAKLYLSLNTVKVHNRHIYAKLNASSRIQAVSKAKALGILTTDD